MDDFLKRVIAQREREQFAKDEGIPVKFKYAEDVDTLPPKERQRIRVRENMRRLRASRKAAP